MRIFFQTLLMLMTISFSASNTYAANDDIDDLRNDPHANEWKVVKVDKSHKITAYDKRNLNQSIRSLKVEFEIDGSLTDIATVAFDYENYKKWWWEILDCRLLKKVSDTEFYYYVKYRAPFPLPPRDSINRVIIEPYTKLRGYAKITLSASPKYLPTYPSIVRMPGHDMSFTFTPTAEKNIYKGLVEGFIEPGGNPPDWAVNAVQRNAPYQTVLGLQRMVKLAHNKTPKPDALFPLE